MPVVARLWCRNFGSYEPVAERSLPACCVDGQKLRAWELEGAVISLGVQVAYREPVATILVEVVILDGIDTNDPHVSEDPQPMWHPALPADVIAQWHL